MSLNRNKLLKVFCITLIFCCSCAGTIQTVNYNQSRRGNYTKAYIISAENSQFIKFRMGIITPFAYIPRPDGPPQQHEVIGNTALVIKAEFEKYGINAEVGKRGDTPTDFDLIVEYRDTWRWDFKKILDKLEIAFITPEGDKLIAKSTYNIFQNKEFHNFPTPEKEVPKMIKQLLNK